MRPGWDHTPAGGAGFGRPSPRRPRVRAFASPSEGHPRHRSGTPYPARPIRVERPARNRGGRIVAVIPEPCDQVAHRKRRGSRGGRPPAFDPEDYKPRNVIERNFNVVKQWRGLATRYDQLAIVCRAAAVLRAITIWLPYLSDTP
jgi:transposase